MVAIDETHLIIPSVPLMVLMEKEFRFHRATSANVSSIQRDREEMSFWVAISGTGRCRNGLLIGNENYAKWMCVKFYSLAMYKEG